ncbi:MAG: FG-GAP repeat protein, partial [Thermoanaerobaculia bacterium]
MNLSRSWLALAVYRIPFAALALFLLAASALDAQAAIGLSGVRAQAYFNEGIEGFEPQAGDSFGRSLAAGDFNGDGAQDLATGIPFDDGPTDLPLSNAGAVIVRWGTPGKGLQTSPPPTLLSLYVAGGQDIAHESDQFGYALAAGDFNGDGRDDLAVGIPGHDYWDFNADPWESGAVQIHYGEPGGIQIVGEHLFECSPDGNIYDIPGELDDLGQALAAGDFDGDGYDDLAIGGPQTSNFDFLPGGGGVVVLHGGIGGLMPVNGYLIHQDDPPVPDDGENLDDFGWALAAGNFNGDFRITDRGIFPVDDLAMSAPGEDGIGAVMVMLGSEFGLIFANSIYLGAGDVGGVGEAGDRFGASLAVGNFDGDYQCLSQFFCTPIDDLVIGTPYENLGASNENADAGEVTVLYGFTGGFFDLARTDHLTQGAIFGSTAYDQGGDLFGFALASGDFDGDGKDDLAVGQPGENVGGANRGGVTILMGAAGGLYDRFRFLAAGINGVQPGPQDGAEMGLALAVGDFDGTGFADLAIGIPYRDQAGIDN